MATLTLRQIERNTTTFVTTDITKTITLATTLLDTAKTILFFTASSGSASPVNYHVLGRVLSTTQIQFERAATPAVDCIVEYIVVEFTQGITVQHMYISQTAASVDTTITAVDLSKTFPILTMNQTGSTFGANDVIKADLTTTTNLQTTIESVSTCPVAVQVVQIDDATVQRFASTYGTGATSDITVTSITENKTFWVFGLTTTAGHTFDDLPYLSYVNATTLRFTRALATGGTDFNYIAFVVSLSARITVQNISTVIASGSNTVSPTIPNAVVVNNTALLLNGVYQRFASINSADDNAANNMFLLNGLTTTAFTATRSASPALAATANVQVLEWVPSTGDWFIDMFQDD